MKKCRVCGKRVNKVYRTRQMKGACRPCVENIYARLGIDLAYDPVDDVFYEDTLRWPWAFQYQEMNR